MPLMVKIEKIILNKNPAGMQDLFFYDVRFCS
jgi:hypothetical protein